MNLTVEIVGDLVEDGHDLARMPLEHIALGLEGPRAMGIRIKLNRQVTSHVHLSILGEPAGLGVIQLLAGGQDIDTRGLADRVVERHQCIAKAEHQNGNHQQLAKHGLVLTGSLKGLAHEISWMLDRLRPPETSGG